MLAVLFTHPLDWLIHDGVGQNLTAGLIVFCLGVVWARTRYWPLHAIHAHLRALHARHDQLGESHEHLHERLERIEALLDRAENERSGPR